MTSESLVAIDPRNGVAFKPGEASDEMLVAAFTELDRRERQFKEWRVLVEEEIVRRHGDRRAARTIGNLEVDVDRGYSRAWDPDDLMATVSFLAQEGLLRIVEVEGLVTEEKAIKPNGRKLASLLTQLEQEDRTEALEQLKGCFRWKHGRAKVKVTPVVALEAPDR